MIRNENHQLWSQIDSFQMDDPSATIKFSDKLSHEHRWSKEYTARVISEYRKFLFLCCVLPGGASPSQIVDEAWHMHLTYTVNYWDELCGKVIQRPLHHHPSKGGLQEKGKHEDWYQKTLEGYKYYFGADPPEDIWPLPAVAVSRQTEIKLPNEKRTSIAYYFFFLVPAFLVLIYFSYLNPFQLNGPQFLTFYSILLGCLIFFLVAWYRRQRKQVLEKYNEVKMQHKSIYQVTRFVYGQNRMLQTAIVDLVEKQVLMPVESNGFIVNKLDTATHSDKNPLLPFIKKYFNEGDRATLANFEAALDESEHDSYDEQLSVLHQSLNSRSKTVIAVFVAVLLLGVMRMIQGFDNQKPTTILTIMCMVVFFAAFITTSFFSERVILQNIVAKKYSKLQLPDFGFNASHSATDFAFLGITAVSGLYGINHLTNSFNNHFKEKDGSLNSSGGSGCGSSCGGSGCGGGGGCGGCGGGD
jgi:uncharacterized protein (TIGR04222 family)